MTTQVTLPLWAFLLILLFAAVTFASHFLFPSVRWFFRRRMERAVKRLNARLERPIQPFKLLRRQDMIQRLVYDPEITQAIVEHAEAEGVREDVAFERARRYAKEIVPSFSAWAYFGFAIRAARFLSTSLYRVRMVHQDAGLASVDPDATVVFVMNHRSNMDYVLVTYLAADRSALSYAVGEWARVWPLSRLIRAMGAYFIRRKSRNDLYRKVLAKYVQQATAAGVTQAVFPEGGLSLDGSLTEPKVGILKYILEGAAQADRDVVFVPVALNYDRVLEDTILLAAQRKGERKFRARISVVFRAVLRQIWLRVTGKFHRFGYAAVSFGEPLLLSEVETSENTPDAISGQIMSRIAAAVPVLPVPLIASLLLKNGSMSRDELEAAVAGSLHELEGAQVHLPRNNRDYAVEFGLRNLRERGLLKEHAGRIGLVPAKEDLAQFYANSIKHLMR
ncbi:1-acyl-sn-glycerol-3-phosphate acyltransferase [uncultured Marivita sp.]|uniref:1-acyl-sn-glycerol-3-phosphate acyltransferase n=1 Tax=Marivita sp. TaxID=2003365 RepID=UPI0025EA9395|nr:1-acyl-sn-glycerol-3-phosphate acyltransferase [uncultured Marivita sp.]MCR9108272.1 1-acyl-sn-glycerol-3-phosphate acyltransferase [Paracoccaceae bacterium]